MNGFNPHQSRGFVLVTSLIFLALITLLVISAVNSSTLQERMASNQREKTRARETADAGLREAEMRLASPAFQSYLPVGGCYGNGASGDDCSGQGALRIWRQGDVVGNTGGVDDPRRYLEDAVWNQPGIQNFATQDTALPSARFVVEEMNQMDPDDANPSTNAKGIGRMRYRITARAFGQNPAATAVSRSVFLKRYPGAN